MRKLIVLVVLLFLLIIAIGGCCKTGGYRADASNQAINAINIHTVNLSPKLDLIPKSEGDHEK
jgi:hypothetical protein